MQRKLLEQMMGPETMGLQDANLNWWDDKVCKNFLCGTCPHSLFTNTKMDLGPCPKSHADKYKLQYNEEKQANSGNKKIAETQREYENNIFQFVDECDRRIRAAHRRLEKTPEENAKTTNLMREIGEIELAIQGGTERIESLGEAGEVEESMRELAAVEALKVEKSEKERELQNLTDTSGASGHQKLRVCDVCGAYLSVLDSDRRLADHFGGKMHLGYHELRKMLEEFSKRKHPALSAGRNPSLMAPPDAPVAPRPPERDHRPRDDTHRERDRDHSARNGYDRPHTSGYRDAGRRTDRDRSRSPRRRY